ncbi:MAG: hypothetical protein AB7U05_15170 [Mangrovibacterium sp.]
MMYDPKVQRTEISANIFGALHIETTRPIFSTNIMVLRTNQ